ncbi:aldo/keto reductase [Burkholderia sp. Bp9143]|uniref:aldo/keto reductase n=1 Tax=Burkholderia sp. Bp9143 TaxID=2184574 RepID=UPI000F5A824D|nr:aldo/keto reductase [Burkholderia sp. Bp9143]RQR24986.1 aldo/keto reductase [Burkholderia sp. Bp9143]
MSITQKTFRLNDDTAIPAVGFGTYLVTPADAPQAVSTAIGLGYRHVDTAAVYQNEEAVGAGIHAGLQASGLNRRDLFVTTKLWPGFSAWSEEPKSQSQTMAAFEESLAKLGLDYLDLYLIHSPQGGQARLDQWRALVELKRAGKVRSIGVSNYSRKHLEEIRAAGLPTPEANQIELHPWSQKPELVAYLREQGIAPIAYSSLAPLSTWRTQPGQDSRKAAAGKDDGPVFADMAAKYGVTEAQLLLHWGVQNGYAVLPKSLNPQRMCQNIDLDGFVIDDPDMALIRTLDRGDGIAWSMGDPSLAD